MKHLDTTSLFLTLVVISVFFLQALFVQCRPYSRGIDTIFSDASENDAGYLVPYVVTSNFGHFAHDDHKNEPITVSVSTHTHFANIRSESKSDKCETELSTYLTKLKETRSQRMFPMWYESIEIDPLKNVMFREANDITEIRWYARTDTGTTHIHAHAIDNEIRFISFGQPPTFVSSMVLFTDYAVCNAEIAFLCEMDSLKPLDPQRSFEGLNAEVRLANGYLAKCK